MKYGFLSVHIDCPLNNSYPELDEPTWAFSAARIGDKIILVNGWIYGNSQSRWDHCVHRYPFLWREQFIHKFCAQWISSLELISHE